MRQSVVNANSSMSVRQSCPLCKGGALIDTTEKLITEDVNDRAALKLQYAKKYTTSKKKFK